MSLKLDLNKAEQTLRLSLQKAGIHNPPAAEVGFNMDVSGSFEDEHRDGSTQMILSRLVPWCMVFDPDKKLDFFTFSSEHGRRPPAHYVGEVTTENYDDYIRKCVIEKVPNWNGGTLYAPILQMNREHFGWVESTQPQAEPEKKGFFGKFFGGGAPQATVIGAPPPARKRSLIMFITDGDNDRADEAKAEKVLADMEAQGEEIYIQFFGFANQSVEFKFLQRMADKFSNTGLYICRDLKKFAKMSDEEINDLIIQDELIAWLKK